MLFCACAGRFFAGSNVSVVSYTGRRLCGVEILVGVSYTGSTLALGAR